MSGQEVPHLEQHAEVCVCVSLSKTFPSFAVVVVVAAGTGVWPGSTPSRTAC